VVVLTDVNQKHRKFTKKYPRKFSKPSLIKEKFSLRKGHKMLKPKATSCFICKKPGHWASQCPLRSKTKVQTKIMDLFLTGYDPAEWDLVSNRSDGEYLSLTEDSDSHWTD
jgi:hypothetical protein